MIEIPNVRVYVITHGRPKSSQRPTCAILDKAQIKYYLVMNEGQVSDYMANGVDRKQIIISTNKFENEYFPRHRTYPVDFHGAICNRERCNIDARKHHIKYAVQLDDNIKDIYVRRDTIKRYDQDQWLYPFLSELIQHMRNICDSTNIGFLGLSMGAIPAAQKRILRVGYAYSFFMENVEANIPWRGPFDDDVTHNLDFNHSGNYTCALLTLFTYGKESKSKTGMRKMYDKYQKQRPMGVANIYPEHVKVGIVQKANGLQKRYYHVFTGPLHKNIRVHDKQKLLQNLKRLKQYADAYEHYRYYGMQNYGDEQHDKN